MDFVYGINPHQITTYVRGNSTITDTTSPFIELNTSTDTTGLATYESVELANYRPGQGIDIRFTTIFYTGTANSTQIVGVGNECNGFFFGYNGTTFGTLLRTSGNYEIRTMTLTTATTSTGTVNITLNGTQ